MTKFTCAIISSSPTTKGRVHHVYSALLVALVVLLIASTAFCDVDPLSCSNDEDNDGLPASSGSPICSAEDRKALLQFKSSISSDPNKALAGWVASGNSSNCCTWNGVTCDSTGRVVRVKLPHQNLKGSISSSLGALSALQVLLLYENSFRGTLPSSLGNLTRLQRLCISSSPSLSGSIPESFGKLSKLQLLDLSSNTLSGPLPTSIGGMSSLQHIRIYGNRISGAIPASFGLLSQLFNADLGNNQLSGRIPDAFTRALSSLAFLFLQNNRITGLPADLRNLKRLQWVDLSNNPLLNSDAVAGLATAPLMTQIELSSCKLSGPFPSWVARLPQPSFDLLSDEVTPSIDLSNNAISGAIPSAVGKLTSLESLDLAQNQLSGPIPASFANLQSLRFFNVSHNHLSGKIPQVAPFTTLDVSSYQPGNPGLCGSPLPACKK